MIGEPPKRGHDFIPGLAGVVELDDQPIQLETLLPGEATIRHVGGIPRHGNGIGASELLGMGGKFESGRVLACP